MAKEDGRCSCEVLLYYRYVLPLWDDVTRSEMQALQEKLCKDHTLSGRVTPPYVRRLG